jgi:predicted nucleic acid-binding protein
MDVYVLDTMVVSNINGPDPNENVLDWIRGVDDIDIYISVVVIMEVRKGIESQRRKLSAKNLDISDLDASQKELSEFVRDHSDQFIPVDNEIAEEWGRLVGVKEKNIVDLLIAATANVKKYTVVTRNEKHFRARSIKTIDPFKKAPSNANVVIRAE